MRTLRRTRVLLEPEQHRLLADMARREGASLSHLLREIIRQHLAEREAQRQRGLRALEALDVLRAGVEKEYGVIRLESFTSAPWQGRRE